jgi:hypothetical protein
MQMLITTRMRPPRRVCAHHGALPPHRVFVNVHHDFELEPRVALHGSRERASGRKKVTNPLVAS